LLLPLASRWPCVPSIFSFQCRHFLRRNEIAFLAMSLLLLRWPRLMRFAL